MALGSPLPNVTEIPEGQLLLEMCVRSLPSFIPLVVIYIHCTVMSTASGRLGRFNKLDTWDTRHYLLAMKDRKGEKKKQNKWPKKSGYRLLIDLNREGGREKFESKRTKESGTNFPMNRGYRHGSQ